MLPQLPAPLPSLALDFPSNFTGAGLLAGLNTYTDNKMKKVVSQSQQTVGKASVGGNFELIDSDGKRFSNRDLLGEFALIYFGFTFCPDICPDELEKISTMVNQVEAKVRRWMRR